MEKVVTFFGRLEYLKAIWSILWPIGNLVAIWYIFLPLWYILPRKIWQPCLRANQLIDPETKMKP
jgi:hypothetical protein